MSGSRTRSSRIAATLASGQVKFRVAAGFVVLVFLLGGGSRYDIASLALLRPLAFGFALYALMVLREGELGAVRTPLGLLLVLAGWLAVQLIPLPPSVWQQLPDRALFAEIYAAAGLGPVWLPLTMSPSRTLNSLLSLSVPLAALLLFAVQEPARRTKLLPVVWVMVLASAALGIAQMTGAANGPLYFYQITTNGLPVGLFANRNHQALLLCLGVLLSGHLVAAAYARADKLRGQVTAPTGAAAAAVLVLAPLLLVTGSRAGLLIAAAMIPATGCLIYLSQPVRRKQARGWGKAWAFAGLLAALLGAFILQTRVLAIDRLLATGGEFELRAAVWPTLAQMAESHWLLGTGFGSFELAFKQVEPLELLRTAYLNQAHNDWVQWVIEGGLPALVILLIFAAWLTRRLVLLAPSIRSGKRPELLLSALTILACAGASLVDYPLRVPSLVLVFALACAFISSAPDHRRQPKSTATREPAFTAAIQGI